jgi:hypothetical protein
MTLVKLTIVPVILLYVAELVRNYDPMLNPWCRDCPGGHGEGKPCQIDKSPFTFAEIADAIERKDFEPLCNEKWGYNGGRNTEGVKNEDLCNRARHIRRIAYLATHCDGRDPIRMMGGCAKISDGGHRFAAAIYRGVPTIQAYIETEQDKQLYKGHLPAEER